MANKTKSQLLEEKLNSNNKRKQTFLKFPLDVDTESTQNIMLININAISGSKYEGTQYRKVEGETARVSQRGSNSLSRHFTGNTVRIDTSIALHMPPNIQASYSAEWAATNLDGMGALVDAWQGFGDMSDFSNWQRAWETGKGAAWEIAKMTGVKMADVIVPGKLFEAYTWSNQMISNPFVEVLFQGISNRQFSFTFKFIPRSKEEQQEIKKIIDVLKFHRAPEKKPHTKNLYWSYPSTFDLMFLKKNGQENEWVFKISTCAMTNLNISQGAENHFATFEDGSPFSTTVTMEFTELEILDKNRILSGF